MLLLARRYIIAGDLTTEARGKDMRDISRDGHVINTVIVNTRVTLRYDTNNFIDMKFYMMNDEVLYTSCNDNAQFI